MNPLSRFKPLDHLPLAPGVCFICKGGIGPYVDTSLTVDYEGAVYVCRNCVGEMAVQLGFNVSEDAEITEKINHSFLLGKGVGVQETMEMLDEFRRNYSDSAGSPHALVAVLPGSDNVALISGTEQSDTEPQRGSVEGSSPVSGQEPGKLSGDSSDGEFSIFNLG